MNKKQNKKTGKDFMSRFTPLSEIVAKELKDPRFRKAYMEEVSRLLPQTPNPCYTES